MAASPCRPARTRRRACGTSPAARNYTASVDTPVSYTRQSSCRTGATSPPGAWTGPSASGVCPTPGPTARGAESTAEPLKSETRPRLVETACGTVLPGRFEAITPFRREGNGAAGRGRVRHQLTRQRLAHPAKPLPGPSRYTAGTLRRSEVPRGRQIDLVDHTQDARRERLRPNGRACSVHHPQAEVRRPSCGLRQADALSLQCLRILA